MDNKKIVIQNVDGTTANVELITYLVSEDKEKKYLVYSHGEKVGMSGDELIYVSRIIKDGDIMKLEEITDDIEWADVQKLLRMIANA